MLRHIVLFEFANEVREERRAEIMAELGALGEEVPAIRGYSWGTNVSPEGLDRGFTVGFVMEFESAAALDNYLGHPAHVKIAGDVIIPALKNGRDSILVFDYEV
jgi:hypothetical protein